MRALARTLRLPLLAVLLAAMYVGQARAGAEPDLKKPYNLQVVLHLADHRALTGDFREELTRQLGDFLRLDFGELAQVEVVHTHPLLNDILAKGLQQALDGWDELSDTRTWFVLIDFVRGRYRIRIRQHDGLTNLSSPLVRETETGDRGLVARKAALLLDHNFAPTGSVVEVKGATVQVALRGGSLAGGAKLKRWLKPGDVLAVARLTEEGDRRRAARVEWALLQVTGDIHDGICSCRYYHRYLEDDLHPEPGVVYRCMKLAADIRPLRLRLLDERDAPLDGLQVHVTPTRGSGERRELSTGQDGLVVTPGAYQNMALVRVLSGVAQVGEFPVAIVDHRTVVCRLGIKPEAAHQQQLALRAERWLRRLYDTLRQSDERVARLNALLSQSPEAALLPAQEGLKSMSAELTSLTEEGAALQAAARENSVRLDLSEGQQRLAELQRRREGLGHFRDRLQEVIREATSPETKALKAAVERATLLQVQAEFQEAITLYKKILAEHPGETKVKEQLDRLQKQWEVITPQHGEARAFLSEVWAKKMNAAELKANLPKARDAFRVCQEVGDRLTPLKMLKSDLAHATALKQRLEVLRRAPDNEDNRAERQLIAQLGEELGRLNSQVSAFLKEEKMPR